MTNTIGLAYEAELRRLAARPITKDLKRERVLLWRTDQKVWEVGIAEPKYFGHPDYAYTHWAPLPDAPRV